MAYKTKDLKVTFLGVTPVLRDESGYLKPQDIVALSALMTFKGKSVKDLYGEAVEKGQDLNKKVKTIIRKSSLRGHASIATTPAICFTYEASKFLDSMMTGMTFSSSLMASGRRTDTTVDDIVYPTSIDRNKYAKALYKKAAEDNINYLNHLLASGIVKDEASKVLQYGIYGTGIIAYPIESIVAFKKEYEAQKEWMPEEAGMIIHEIEKQMKKMGVDLIYASRQLAARNVFPFPNIFKNPVKTNIARELIGKNKLPEDLIKIVDFCVTQTPNLEKEAGAVWHLSQKIWQKRNQIKKRYRELLAARHELMRDYNTALNLKILSRVSWRVWSEKKRHRTVPMTPDSLYFAIDCLRPIFQKYAKKIAAQKLTVSDIKIIDRYFTVPISIKNKKDLLYGYLRCVKNSLDVYFTLVEKYKIRPADTVFVMPRGVRIDIVQNYDLFNLISGYFPVRTCSTAEIQLRQMTLVEMAKIKSLLIKKGLPNLAKIMTTKCHIPGFCLEEKHCPVIGGLIKNYNDKFHEDIKAHLDEEFEQKLTQLK